MFERMNKQDLEQRLRQACSNLGVRYEVTISTDVARELLRLAAEEAKLDVVERIRLRAEAERRCGRVQVADALEAAAAASSLSAVAADCGYLIRYSDGAYNQGTGERNGFPCDRTEATRYVTLSEAQEKASSLIDVAAIEDAITGKDVAID